MESEDEWVEFRENIERLDKLLWRLNREQLQDLKDMGRALLRAHESLEELLKIKEMDIDKIPHEYLVGIYYELAEKKKYLDAELEDVEYFLQKISEMDPIINTNDEEIRNTYLRFLKVHSQLYEEQLRAMLLESEILNLHLLRIKIVLYEI